MDSPTTSSSQLAREALDRLSALAGPEEQCRAGVQTLHLLADAGDAEVKAAVEHALAVMAKFPNFPRPRARIVLRALERLAQAGSCD